MVVDEYVNAMVSTSPLKVYIMAEEKKDEEIMDDNNEANSNLNIPSHMKTLEYKDFNRLKTDDKYHKVVHLEKKFLLCRKVERRKDADIPLF